MRIAVFHELPVGGARRATYDICKAMENSGHKIDIFYTGSQEDKDISSSNAKYYPFIAKKWKGKNWKTRLYKDTVELVKLDRLHERIANDINSNNYDLVLVNGSEYIEAPFILKYLTIYNIFYCHDPSYRILYEDVLSIKGLSKSKAIYEKLNRNIRKLLDKKNFQSASEIYSNSFYSQKIIFETYKRKSTVVYLGIDTNFFKPENHKKKYDLLFVGSRNPVDGYDLLDKAKNNLPLRLKIRTVMFEDEWLSKNEMKKLYNESKIVVCLSRNEPFGLVPLESMSCGTPVIAVDEGGYRETVVNGATGMLIRSYQELAKSIDKLLSDNNLTNKMSKEARRYVLENWGWNKKTNIFNEAIKRSYLNSLE